MTDKMTELVRRADVQDEIDRWLDSVGTIMLGKGLSSYGELIGCVEDAPAADVTPAVYGFWAPITESEMTGWDTTVAGRDPIGEYICSVCGNEAIYDCNDKFILSNYCPNCGAKMDKEAET